MSASASRASAPRASTLRVSDLRYLGALSPSVFMLLILLLVPGWAALAALVTWVVIVGVEAFWAPARRSPRARPAHPALSWILRLYVPLQLAVLAAAFWAARGSDWLTVLGLAYGVGFITGAQGITFAHELGHSPRRADRAMAWVLMACVAYPQFMVEHYRGHHVRAATHDDPASGRPGESLWRFLPRTIVGSALSAARLEAQRLRRQGRGWVASPLAWCWALNAAVALALLALGATQMLTFWLAQSAFAVWLLETVNYIEHYGLQRRTGPNGRPEPFGAHHAWNADHFISNSLLANLQRHSDHHLHAGKRYPELVALANAPQLPASYSVCLLLAAIPPWWFALMEPRLRANASPGPVSP
ncbi:MAG: alkane 1-monooxygenase [Pseudomonadota bacterium]